MEERKVGSSTGRRQRVACVRCIGETWHTVLTSVDVVWEELGVSGENKYQVLSCDGCESLSFRIERFRDDDDGWEDPVTGAFVPGIRETLFPPRILGRPLLEDSHLLPPEVQFLYTEVHTALGMGLDTLAGVGMRSLVERVCLAQGATGWGLEAKLTSWSPWGGLPARRPGS